MPISNPDPVLSRHSIRQFTDQPVDDSQIHALLEAAMSAPSADDERPWHFVIVKENSVLSKLSSISPQTSVVDNAPVCIVVCGDESLQKQLGCWALDCAAATENILIEAQIINLGAVWLGIYPVQGKILRVQSILSAPQNVIPFSIIPIGHPAEQKAAAFRYDNRRIHLERWISKPSTQQSNSKQEGV